MNEKSPAREFDSADTPQPAIAILGVAPWTSIISNAGGGQTRFGQLAVNRWRNDGTLDDHGHWCYVRDITAGQVWSATHQPMRAKASSYRVRFESDRAVFDRADGEIETRMEVAVSSRMCTEFRRVTLFNKSDVAHEIELTSYSEIVIAPMSADRGHPAFHSLFVQTEWIEGSATIVAMRRPRSASSKPLWCGHALSVGQGQAGSISCETDRAKFVGRGRSTGNPVAMDKPGELSGRAGAVLDPIFAIRTRLSVPPGGSAQATFATFMAEDRDGVATLAKSYHDPSHVAGAFDAACAEARDELRDSGISAEEVASFEELAGHLLYPPDHFEAGQIEAASGTLGQTDLRRVGITGDVPVLLAVIRSMDGLPSVKQLLSAHRYWQLKGIDCDLVILAQHAMPGLQEITDEVSAEVGASERSTSPDYSGGVLVLRSDLLEPAELALLSSVSGIRVECDGSELGDILKSLKTQEQLDDVERLEYELPSTARSQADGGGAKPDGSGLQYFNGIGGFNDDNEYEIRLTGDDLPPAPWINVIANESGGFIASETGAGSTWAVSSNSFRLTPWRNDPVCDPPGECLYLRDDDTGDLWTPTAAPIRDRTGYTVKHGAGYSTFEHVHDEIATSLRMGVPEVDPVKLQVLTLTNNGSRPRRITLVSYVEWVLGTDRETTRQHVRTALDSATEVMLASNAFDPEFAGMTAFCAISEPLSGHTTSRHEFLGRNGSLSVPDALAWRSLSGETRNTGDPCSALEMRLELSPGETKSISVILGAAQGADDAIRMAERYRAVSSANVAMEQAIDAWRARLGTISVRTPDAAFDLMLNQWAFYQALSCRVWGRTALYQSSGAYGFRDQLQDVMAFTCADPRLTRDQIVRAASRQFEEGDVQHWWHPHSGRGVRTRFSDDLVWLPFVVNHYLAVTHDTSVLDERAAYLWMKPLAPDEDERYALPEASDIVASVFDHCIHALNRACTVGRHGLPLIRSGDWNDGMNRVGIEGKGESVWLAWFLITTLRGFADHADARGYSESAAEFRHRAQKYSEAVERSAWDGEWYRRAYYDDGAPLGSHVNEECQIDSIAQSWSVISGAGDPDRRRTAMRSLNERLVREDARLIMLLTPPFDRGAHDPGYIQGYLPGVRENGAQYTHAALWAVLATALQGDGNRAMELYQMINPITHGSTAEQVAEYKVEPYVVAADVYTAEGHLGRGGWTWYTGSASWLYRVGLEAILGFTKLGDELEVNPCIPADWKEFSIDYRYGESMYTIVVRNPSGVQKGVSSVTLDGAETGSAFRLVSDGRRHEVVVIMG